LFFALKGWAIEAIPTALGVGIPIQSGAKAITSGYGNSPEIVVLMIS
jgi:hypothetical protein